MVDEARTRLKAIDNFTSTIHSKIPASISPNGVTLPRDFTVCIIGSSEGIGEHVAYAYATAGASHIIISSRSIEALEAVAARIIQIKPEILVDVVACDITSATSVAQLADHVKTTRTGRLDALVSNPGYAGPVTLKVTDGEPAWFQENFNVNVVGTYHAAHYFIPLLTRTRGGAGIFIVVGSMAGSVLTGPIANTGYCLSKCAQSRFVEYLDMQFGGAQNSGLLAVAVHPGAVATNMAAENTPEEFLPYLVDDVGLCGAFCVWLSKQPEELAWLGGRILSANWDVDELVARKEQILEKDALKWAVVT